MKKQYEKPVLNRSEFSVSDIITSSGANPFQTAMKAMTDVLGPDNQRYIEDVKYGEWN